MSEPILSQGFNLMLFGMGTVFVFLTLLVLGLGIMSRLLNRFFPESAEPLAANPAPSKSLKVVLQADQRIDSRTIKVIQAAVNEHRKR